MIFLIVIIISSQVFNNLAVFQSRSVSNSVLQFHNLNRYWREFPFLPFDCQVLAWIAFLAQNSDWTKFGQIWNNKPNLGFQVEPLLTRHLPLASCFLPLLTGHLSLASCHLPLATAHLPLVTAHLPLVTCLLPLATSHCSLAIYHWSLVICHWSLVICHLSLLTCHLPLLTCHLPLITCHLPLLTCHWSLLTCPINHYSLIIYSLIITH